MAVYEVGRKTVSALGEASVGVFKAMHKSARSETLGAAVSLFRLCQSDPGSLLVIVKTSYF